MIVTKEQIVEMLKTRDLAVARALVAITRNQTATEQSAESTINRNGMGWRPCHARMGTSMSNFFTARGYLTPKQLAYWRAKQRDGKMRIEIYANQLLAAAKLKEAAVTAIAIDPPKLTGSYAQAAAARDGMVRVNGEFEPNPYIGADVGNLMEERMVLQEQLDDVMDSDDPELIDPLANRIKQIDLAVAAMRAEADMHRMEADADRDGTRNDELNKFLARCRMERQ